MKSIKMVRLGKCSKKEREALLKRSELNIRSIMPRVTKIISDVQETGDKALLKYGERFDGVKLRADELRVSRAEFRSAYRQLDATTVRAIKKAAESIRKFHLTQLPREWTTQLTPGVKAGQLVRPLESVGVYVPGGLARYPSSLLMAAIPARIAGVKRVIVCTPPDKKGKVNAAVIAAAKVAGVDAVFKVGGAQAIAAIAYGTETVPRVDKIVGAGNIYVVAAKQVVAPDVDIDFAAGPSEILIVADNSATPKFIATDLVSQAEHDPNAAAVLVTTSKELASRVQGIVEEIIRKNPRRRVVRKALQRYGRIIIVRNLDEAIEFANSYAPEHLALMVKRPWTTLKRITNAGSIFLGAYSPVAAGDFAVGPNHILPTGGAARRRSGLSVLDFLRLPTVQELSRKGLMRVAETAEQLAEVEGLPGHARSIRERLKEE